MSRGIAGLVLLAVVFSTASPADTISVTDAWIAAAPPSAAVLAGYMQISNAEPEKLQITGFTSARFDTIEMHRTVVEQGMASMQKQSRLEVPASGSLLLAPQGLHLMLIEPANPVVEGETIPFTATLGDGRRITFDAVVRRRPAQ